MLIFAYPHWLSKKQDFLSVESNKPLPFILFPYSPFNSLSLLEFRENKMVKDKKVF